MSDLLISLSDGPAKVLAGPLPQSSRTWLTLELPDAHGGVKRAMVTLDAREALKLSQFLFGAACDAMGLDLALEVAKR